MIDRVVVVVAAVASAGRGMSRVVRTGEGYRGRLTYRSAVCFRTDARRIVPMETVSVNFCGLRRKLCLGGVIVHRNAVFVVLRTIDRLGRCS